MTNNNKLPQKKTTTLNTFKVRTKRNGTSDTDTSSTILTTLTSTHIFNK